MSPRAAYAAPQNALLGVFTLTETSLITLSLGIRRLTLAVPGAVAGGNYLAFPVNALPAGYGIVDAICGSNGSITFGLIVPALGIATTYSIPVRVVEVGT